MKKLIFHVSCFMISMVVIIVVFVSLLNFVTSDKKYYQIPQNKTTLIAGHSHSECSYDTKYINYAINISQSGEHYLYTYLKVKKVVESNPQIKNVIIEFTYNVLDESNAKKVWSNSHIQNKHVIYSQLFSPKEYFLFIKNNLKQELIIEGKSLRKKMTLLLNGKQRVMNNLDFGAYKNLNVNKVTEANFSPNKKIIISNFSNLNLNYLIKTINFCKKSKLNVILVRSPLHQKYEYRDNENLFLKIKNEYFSNINFIDFVNYKLKDEDFADFGHLNNKGAKKISIHLNKVLINNLE